MRWHAPARFVALSAAKGPHLLLLLLMLTAHIAFAQGAAPTYQPGINVVNYEFGLVLPDSGSLVRGDAIIAVRRSAGVSRLSLDLVDALTVRQVDVNGRGVKSAHVNGRIDIPLDGTGDSLEVHVAYDGPVSDGLVVRKDAKGRWTWFGDTWPNRARHWLPTVDHPSDKASVTWKVTAAPELTVVANGSLVSENRVSVDGIPRRETRWRESRPIPTDVMVIAAAPLVRFDINEPACHLGDEGQCVRQMVYVMPENAAWLPGVFTSVGPIVSLFERLVGPFPYEKLAHLESSTRFGGMENASAIFYDGKLFSAPTIKDGLLAHETAHQWFGDAVTEREWSHLWLSEGFATYFAALWTKQARGDAAYRTEMAGIRDQVLAAREVATRPVIDTAQTDYMALLNTNSYQKGGYVLYMLHEQLGDSAFFGALRSYYATYRHGTALSDDLRREFEKTSGRSLTQFFEQWLRRPGFATPTLAWEFDGPRNTVTVRVVQESAQGAYELWMPVAITDAAGTTTRLSVKIPAEARSSIVLPGRYTSKPASVVFDPDNRLLARIVRQ
ncbi:MAG: M1 family metallopeptidase [Gemmatimonadota bacterium]